MDCTKYAYGFGKECYANRGVFIELLKRERVLVGKKYEPQFHYHYVSRLFAKIAGITVNAGEISRIALVCMHVHGANIAPNELPAWFQQVGGLRKTYQLTVRQRADEPANDNDDLKLHFNVIGSNGFQGILDITPTVANKLLRRYGITNNVGSNSASNDNQNNNERNANHA